MFNTTGIYLITNLANGKIYVGSAISIGHRWKRHISCLNRGVHHNAPLQNAWSKYGQDKFEIAILETCEPDSLTKREQFWLDKLGAAGENGYNILPMAKSSLGLKHKASTLAKISKTHKGKTISESHRQILSAVHTGKKISDAEKENRRKTWTPERRARQSEISRSIVLTDESKAKISAAHKGRTITQEWRDKISAARKGQRPSDEVRAKLRAGQKNRPPISDETRRKMAEARAAYWERKKAAQTK